MASSSSQSLEQLLRTMEYMQWRNTAHELYDIALNYSLEWPSLTVDWSSDWGEIENCYVQNVVLGTHVEGDSPCYLVIAEVRCPYKDGGSIGIRIIEQILHRGSVNRARCMPTKPSVIATMSSNREVYVFDRTRKDVLTLRGHDKEGFALSWSPLKPGLLLSAADDAKICLWDVNMNGEDRALNAMQTFRISEAPVQDVAWHHKNVSLFGSVAEDNQLRIWDLRSAQLPQSVRPHEREVNCLAFSPYNDWMVLTGSNDKTVKLFDMRKNFNALQTFSFHSDDILQVGWCPKNPSVFASCGRDRRVMVWDINRTNEEQTPEEATEGPPELLFIHGGHTDKITDFSWNPCEEWLVASVDDSNILQIWQMGDHIYSHEDDLPYEFCFGPPNIESKTEVKTEVETEVKTKVETEVGTEVKTEVNTDVKTEETGVGPTSCAAQS